MGRVSWDGSFRAGRPHVSSVCLGRLCSARGRGKVARFKQPVSYVTTRVGQVSDATRASTLSPVATLRHLHYVANPAGGRLHPPKLFCSSSLTFTGIAGVCTSVTSLAALHSIIIARAAPGRDREGGNNVDTASTQFHPFLFQTPPRLACTACQSYYSTTISLIQTPNIHSYSLHPLYFYYCNN